jgi:hypothetical protein
VRDILVKIVGIEFFCNHRDRPGSLALRDELPQEHWSYMDGRVVARAKAGCGCATAWPAS